MERTDTRYGGSMATVLVLVVVALASMTMAHEGRRDREGERSPNTLYVWAGDQARVAPDFLAVIDFDEDSPRYGEVVGTVPVPGPGSSGNEPHHCHLSADKNVLACGGLLALLRGQNSIFFFDVSRARHPKFLFSTSGTVSNITDDFLPLKQGRLPGHADGRPRRRHARSRRRVRRQAADGGRMAGRSAGARFQPARDLRTSGSQSDGDVRLHDARELVERRSRRSAAARKHPRVGSEESNDPAHGRDPERDRHHGRQADPEGSAGSRVHGRHVRRFRVPRRHQRTARRRPSSTARPSCPTSTFPFAEG